MKVLVSWSGGKDCSLAAYKAISQGHRVSYLLNFISEDGRRSRSHGIRREVIELQAEAMGIPLIQVPTSWEEYEGNFKRTVRGLEVEGGVFGDIEIEEHRRWVERVCDELGIEPFLPLWRMDPDELLDEFLELGFRAVVVATRLDKNLLGRALDKSLLSEVKGLGAHPSGEHGEYHTFVTDGPIFKRPLKVVQGEVRKRGEAWFLDLRGAVRRAVVAIPGACGELVQGTIDGVRCLVSCPIDRMVEVEVVVTPGSGRITAQATMPKTHRAVQLALEELGQWDVDVRLERRRGLPEAKGYASSTADILAAVFGLGQALGEQISAEWATHLALEVEPTDSLAWEGLALLAHRDGQLMEPLGPLPPLCVLVLDWGGEVDTLEFNRADHRAMLQRLAPLHREAFNMLRAGVASGSIELIGRAATLSAKAHQCILFKPQLDIVVKLAEAVGAPGVCVAHSGTLIGVLLRPQDAADIASYILSRLPDEPMHGLYRVVKGGPRYIKGKPSCRGI